jgi:hypothetical protein
MKFLLSIDAHADTPEDAIRLVRLALGGAVFGGKPKGIVMGDSHGTAGVTWRVLSMTSEGDSSTGVRRVGGTPEWLSQAMNEGDGVYRP